MPLEKTLESPFDSKEIQQVHPVGNGMEMEMEKEISPEYSLEGLMLKLTLQSFGHLMRITDSFEKTLVLVKIKGKKRRG